MMKVSALVSILIGFYLAFCHSQDTPSLQILTNVSYGSDPQQIMDVYLPPGRDPTVSKVIFLIHGGGWAAGDKTDFNFIVPFFYSILPRYAIVNINYRLATVSDPGFPKQILDIQMAINFIKANAANYKIMPKFGLVGASAGGHLAMLYGYGVDKSADVNVIANVVGPSDLTDPSYRNNPYFDGLGKNLVGNYTYSQNPYLYAIASPVFYINSQSPKTISFYGGMDPLIPVTQGGILEDKLDSVGVYNKFYLYPDEGHGFTNPTNVAHYIKKMTYFMRNYL